MSGNAYNHDDEETRSKPFNISQGTFGATDIVEESSNSLAELTLSIHNHLNSIKNYKKNLAKRFEDIDMSSKKNGAMDEESSVDKKVQEMQAKYNQLEDSYSKNIKETVSAMKESKLNSDKKNSSFDEEIAKKNKKIEELMAKLVENQEKINSLESRNLRLETLNSTLANQLKDKTIELSNHASNSDINLEKKKKELQVMKSEFQKVIGTIETLEENVKTLKEAKKNDSEKIDNLTKNIQELQNENFNLLVENKKLKNQIADMNNQNEGLNRWFMERKERSNQFISEIAGHSTAIQQLSQNSTDIESVVAPLKTLNSKLLKEKENLLEENRKLKLAAGKESTKMVIEDTKPTGGDETYKMVTAEFYKDLFDKLMNKENQVAQNLNLSKERDREITKLKQKIVELEEELESSKNSKKRVKKNIETDVEENSIKKPAMRTEPKILKVPEKRIEETKDIKSEDRDPLNFLEDNGESGEKDARLKITRKPKVITTEKKESKPFALFNTLTICAGCTMIVKKGDKSEPCTRCNSVMHDKCVKALDGKNLCKACLKKAENEKAEKEGVSKQSVDKTSEKV